MGFYAKIDAARRRCIFFRSLKHFYKLICPKGAGKEYMLELKNITYNVDDEQGIREVLREYLELEGYEVDEYIVEDATAQLTFEYTYEGTDGTVYSASATEIRSCILAFA